MIGREAAFSVDLETNEIEGALRGRQDLAGDSVNYYRFSRTDSATSNLYDEGTGVGRVFDGPIPLPVMHVTHGEGPSEDRQEGFYYSDSIHFTAGYTMLRRAGLTEMDLNTGSYLKDRLVYDNKVFRVMDIQVLGQIQRRDVVVGVDAVQMKPDELTGDSQFQKWAIIPA